MKQTLAGGWIEPVAFLNNLKRYIAMQDFVVCATDSPHATFADLGENATMAQSLADQGCSSPQLSC